MTQSASPEKGALSTLGREGGPALIVTQPQKLEGLLETIALLDRISERLGEDRSGDMGGGGGATGGQQSGSATVSARQQKIANLPAPEVMRKTLARHIEKEVRVLQKEIRKAAQRASRPGGAYKLNILYGRIRRLNTLLAELVDAAIDVLKRLFIKVVIDEQKIL